MELILPPTIKRPPERPAKKRKKEADEGVNPKLSKKGQQANCTKCGKTGAEQQPRRHPSSSQEQQPRRHPSSSQEHQPGRQKLPIRRTLSLPTIARWMPNAPSSQQSTVSNPPNQ
ncbi:hypothetical protein V6N13_006227 [Hibiscus sabdariffa]